ncbi:MAG: hypothetical protein ACJ790_12170 [Myxococcaceae bacterium]
MRSLRILSLLTLLSATAFAGNVTLKFQGTAKDALKAIAAQGGVNLIFVGELNTPMEVYLTDASVEDALNTVALTAKLHVERAGTIWTVRPMTDAEKAAPPQPPVKLNDDSHPQFGPGSKVGPGHIPNVVIPPIPNIPPVHVDAKDIADKAAVQGLVSALDALSQNPNLDEDNEEELREASKDLEQAQDELADATDEDDIKEAKEQLQEARREAQRVLTRAQARIERNAEKAARQAEKAARKQTKQGDAVNTGRVVVPEGKTVDNAISYGGGVEVLGSVTGDVVAFGGGVHLGPRSEVDGDVTAFGGSIARDEGAVVHGQEISWGGAKTVTAAIATQVAQATAANKDEQTPVPPEQPKAAEPVQPVQTQHGFFGTIAAFLARFTVLFALGFLFSLFAPTRMKALEKEIQADPGKSLVTGMVGAVALLPLTVLLAITIIGIPFMIALWVMASLGFAMGFAAFASELGMKLPVMRGRKTQAIVLAVGLLSLMLIGMIPYVGKLVELVCAMVGFGAIIRTRFGSIRQLGMPDAIGEIPA